MLSELKRNIYRFNRIYISSLWDNKDYTKLS